MTDNTDELMKSYEVIRSIVMRHSQYDAAMILTLNLATCITAVSREDEIASTCMPWRPYIKKPSKFVELMPMLWQDRREGKGRPRTAPP